METNENPMKKIYLSKVTVNMGVGKPGDDLDRAKKIMESLTENKTVETKAKVKLPKWEIRPGLPIGVKTTLRGEKAATFLKRALLAKANKLSARNFDKCGNFGFGIHEHIELHGVKYDPKLGIRGLDVLVSLARPGYRVRERKRGKGKIGKKHLINKPEAIAFVKQNYGVEIE